MMSLDMISQQSQYELPQSRLRLLAVYIDVIEWSVDTQHYLVDPSSIQILN